MPVHLEFTLHYLMERAELSIPRANHRLDGFENTLAALARRWRPERPLAPARELRMADETREAFLDWVESEEPSQGHTLERLAVYASGAVTDESVPEGWVRLNLNAVSAAN
jgi:hypothetical protein